MAYNGVISGNGEVTQAGPGMLIFNGNHTYTGLTTISAGNVADGQRRRKRRHCRRRGLAGPGYGSATLAFARSDTVTYGGSVSGNGYLAQQGPGNLILTGTIRRPWGRYSAAARLRSARTPTWVRPGICEFYRRHLGVLRSADLVGANSGRTRTPARSINTNGFNVTLTGKIQVPASGVGTLIQNG